MTDREKKSMRWAGGLLLGAALIRIVVAPSPAATPLDDRPSIGDSLLAAGDAAVEEKERRSRPFAPGETIDPNVASDEELDRLPGVGPARALDIVNDREENGPFRAVEDLARVRGVGPASVERMRPHLRLDPAAIRGGPTASARSPSGPVDLNRATAEELQEVPGIGPAIAARIVAYREENGPFRQVDELVRVKGLGEKTVARIAPHVTVGR